MGGTPTRVRGGPYGVGQRLPRGRVQLPGVRGDDVGHGSDDVGAPSGRVGRRRGEQPRAVGGVDVQKGAFLFGHARGYASCLHRQA